MDAKRKKTKPKCLTCPRPSYSRGLCPACLRAAQTALAGIEDAAAKAAMEAKLIRLKLLLPQQKPGPSSNPWRKRFEEIAGGKAVKS